MPDEENIGNSPLLPSNEPQQSRYDFYRQLAQKQLDQNGTEFFLFTEDSAELVSHGDALLYKREATGYNILISETDMRLASNNLLIFYSNYSKNTDHFAQLLSEMEQAGIISPDSVSFGSKASKVVFEGEWEVGAAENIKTMLINTSEGDSPRQIDETVETVITFRPKDLTAAAQIVSFLIERTDINNLNAVRDSWQIPDIRTTIALAPILADDDRFAEALANIYTADTGQQLVVMRQSTSLAEPFRPSRVEVNTKLAEFFVSKGVKP